jgi:tetratricopeptide (TPR) repeat protein
MSDTLSDFEKRIQRARRALQGPDIQPILKELQKLQKQRPDHPELMELFAIAYARLEDRDRAREYFERAIELCPGRASTHYNFAVFLCSIHDLEEAASENHVALYLDPHHPGALELSGTITQRLRDTRRTDPEGFDIIEGQPDPIHHPPAEWAEIRCRHCGSMNFITARTCFNCMHLLPASD